MVFLHKDKAFLHDLLTQIDAYLRDNLHLTIKANYQVFPIAKNRSDKHGRGLDFVGFVFYHEHKLIFAVPLPGLTSSPTYLPKTTNRECAVGSAGQNTAIPNIY